MQFRLIPAFLVFLGSYFPLAVILALQDIKQEYWGFDFCWSFRDCILPSSNHPYLSLFGVSLTLACLLLTIYVLRALRYKYPVTITASKPIPSELISYSFPYIVSFMGVDYATAGKIAGLVVFLLWLFLITYRAGYIIMNPMLLILGWNLYEAEAQINGHKRVIKLLSRSDPTPGKYLCQEVQGSYINMGEKQE
jgi:hypothetical protein